MVRFERPGDSWNALDQLLEDALVLVRALGLRYRVLRLATGDLTFASAMTYDIETWAPGDREWLEVSSVSNFLDFQARRANLRFRNADGGVEHLHTLNGERPGAASVAGDDPRAPPARGRQCRGATRVAPVSGRTDLDPVNSLTHYDH